MIGWIIVLPSNHFKKKITSRALRQKLTYFAAMAMPIPVADTVAIRLSSCLVTAQNMKAIKAFDVPIFAVLGYTSFENKFLQAVSVVQP